MTKRNYHVVEKSAWLNMINSCMNPRHVGYPGAGALGVMVHPDWLDAATGYRAFLDHVGKKPDANLVLQRIDTSGDFEPGNIQWGKRRKPASGRRGPGLLITINGVTKRTTEWAEQAGISHGCLYGRLQRGLTGPALLAPAYKCRRGPSAKRASKNPYLT